MEHDPPLGGAGAPKPPLATLCAAFDHAVATSPHKVALRHFGVALTYRELGRAVTALAKRLASIVAPGEVMALVLPNSIEFPIAYFATLKALATPALFNPLYPAVQLSPLLREANARAVLCASATKDMVAGLARDLSIPGVVCLGQDITVGQLVAEAQTPFGLRTATPEDPGALCFRGGPPGLPKAVGPTHGPLGAALRGLESRWPTHGDRAS